MDQASVYKVLAASQLELNWNWHDSQYLPSPGTLDLPIHRLESSLLILLVILLVLVSIRGACSWY